MTREQEIYNNMWNEIDKRIIVPKITREQLKAVIANILDGVTVIRYEFSGNDKNSLKLCAIFIAKENCNEGQSFYENFYDELKKWYISEYAKVNPFFTHTDQFKNVFLNYMENYLCGYLNDEVFSLNHFFCLTEWHTIFFGNKKSEIFEYVDDSKIIQVNYI